MPNLTIAQNKIAFILTQQPKVQARSSRGRRAEGFSEIQIDSRTNFKEEK